MPLTLPSLRRRAVRAARPLLPAIAVLAAACGGGDGDPTGNGNRRTTAVVNVTPQFVLAPTTANLRIRATTVYALAAGGTAPLGTVTADVPSPTTQTVPVAVDLATCVNDPARAGATQGTPATPTCTVGVELALLSGDRVVDAQSFTGLTLQGGTTTAQSVTFTEITGVRVALPDGTAVPDGGPVRAEVGTPITLTATALRADGAPVAGRAVRWTSEAPAVAQVNEQSGAVTPATPGQARLVATVAGRTSVVALNVVAAPSAVTVAGVAGASGSGRITSSPAGINCTVSAGAASGTCSAPFASDQAVTLTALPDVGSTFAAWTGNCDAAPGAVACTIAPGTPRAVQARFTAVRSLSVGLAGSGGGRVTGGGIDCAAPGASGCSIGVPDGTPVTLTAASDANSRFAGWTGACSTSDVTCTVTLDQARSVTATFNARVSLTLVASGPGAGAITVTGGGASNGTCATTGAQTTCVATVDRGAAVVVAAAPAAGNLASGDWTGGTCAGPAATECRITISGPATVGAAFAARPAPTPTNVRVTALSENGSTFRLVLTYTGTYQGRPIGTPTNVNIGLNTNDAPVVDLTLDAGTEATLRFGVQGSGRIRSFGGACAGASVVPADGAVVCRFNVPANGAVTVTAGP